MREFTEEKKGWQKKISGNRAKCTAALWLPLLPSGPGGVHPATACIALLPRLFNVYFKKLSILRVTQK
tara:strand:- start:392711 stop:392914 length:204 start_codon:yes stop_codon:yes gene_type:complete